MVVTTVGSAGPQLMHVVMIGCIALALILAKF